LKRSELELLVNNQEEEAGGDEKMVSREVFYAMTRFFMMRVAILSNKKMLSPSAKFSPYFYNLEESDKNHYRAKFEA
jgi:hypothetical protein